LCEVAAAVEKEAEVIGRQQEGERKRKAGNKGKLAAGREKELEGKAGPKPTFDGPLGERLNESLAAWGQDPPQFGGHYYLFGAHLGTGSVLLGVADLKTGKTGFMEQLNVAIEMDLGGHEVQEYRAGSRLLVIRGCIKGACGTHYYAFDDVNGRRVQFVGKGKNQEPGDGATSDEPEFMSRQLKQAELESKSAPGLQHDSSTNNLIRRYRKLKEKP